MVPVFHGSEFTAESTFFSFRSPHLTKENLLLTSTHLLGYIGEFEIIDDHRSGKIVIQLNGHLNKTGVISPRFNIQVTQIENWVNLLLPARGFGILILVRGLFIKSAINGVLSKVLG